MKNILLQNIYSGLATLLLFTILPVVNKGQCPVPTISSSGPVDFCEGDQVVLTANTGTDTWTRKSDFGGVARNEAVAFSIGNNGYIGLGKAYVSQKWVKYTDFWSYDPATDTWTQRADFEGERRENPVAFSVNGKGYIGTGIGALTYLKDFWEYDPAANDWIRKADFGGAERYAAAGFSIGSKGYLTGGGIGFSWRYNDLWEYDPSTDQWLEKASVPAQARGGATAFSIDGKGYMGMGASVQNITLIPLKDFWEYNPAVDSWTRKADFEGDNWFHTSFSIGAKGYVTDFFSKNFWQYDPAFDAWTLKKPFPGTSRYSVAGFSIGGKGYLGTGEIVGASLKDFWEYKPEDDFNYLWSTGETTSSIIVKTAGSFNVSTSNSQGCTATSASTDVTVGAAFPAPMIIADGPTTFCPGKTVTLSVNSFWENDPAGSTGADYTYLWSNGETSPTIVVGTEGIYTLRVTNATGCSQVTAPIQVKFDAIPAPTIESNRRLTGIEAYWFCQGETADFTAIPANPDPGITYLWSTGATTQSISVADDRELYVTITDQNGCSATTGYFYAYVEPTPENSGIYTVPPDCSGKNGLIAIFVETPGNTSSYTIDGFATGSSGNEFSGLGPGTYLIGVQSYRGCRSELTPITLDAAASSEVQIVCPPGLEVSASQGACSADVVVNPPAASGGCGELTVTSSHAGTSFPVGTTVITWTATDSNGETATCEQTLTVTDQTPPSITCPGDILVETTSSNGEVVNFATPVAGDNCTSVSVMQIEGPSSGSVFPIGTTKVTFKATDAAQNTATCSFNITVVEKSCSTPPTFTLDVKNASCNGAATGAIIITASGGTGSYNYSINNGATYSSSNSFYELSAGDYQVVVESNGCVSPATEVVLTASTSGPLEITCPSPLVQAAASVCMAVVDPGTPLISGGCPPITITRSYPGNTFPVGKTIIRWEAKDADGQTAFCEQLITVLDKTPPTIICPADMIVQPTSLSGAKVNFSNPTVTDNCGGTSLTQTAGPSSGSAFPIGTTTITFRATDASGNTATCSFTVRVADPYCSGNGNNRKVYICHKGQTICVSVNALGAHLGHGDQLGQCGSSYTKPSAQPVSPAISVYPNPTKGQFTVQLNNMPASDASLLILDVTGRVIETRSVKKAGFPATIPVNLKNKVPGIYIVRFISNGEAYNTRIIVE